MSRLATFLGFVLPLVLIAVNLIWGFGGILAFILLVLWIGVSIFFLIPEERTAV